MTWLERLRRRRQPPLPCQEVVELVTSYLENSLPPGDHARMSAHLAACPGCGAYVEQMRDTLSLLGRLAPQDVSADAQRALGEAFRAWRAGALPAEGQQSG